MHPRSHYVLRHLPSNIISVISSYCYHPLPPISSLHPFLPCPRPPQDIQLQKRSYLESSLIVFITPSCGRSLIVTVIYWINRSLEIATRNPSIRRTRRNSRLPLSTSVFRSWLSQFVQTNSCGEVNYESKCLALNTFWNWDNELR